MTAIRHALVMGACAGTIALSASCGRADAIDRTQPSTEVSLTNEPAGARTTVSRTNIAKLTRVEPGGDPEDPSTRPRTITIPEGTKLDVELDSSLASDTSRVEQPVRASVMAPLVIDDVLVIPVGSTFVGYVTAVRESGKVQGRAELGFRFTRLRVGSVTYDLATKPHYYRAESAKEDDVVKIGATEGGEIRLASGRRLRVSLTNSLIIRSR